MTTTYQTLNVSTFCKEILISWQKIKKYTAPPAHQIIHNNKNIKVNNKSIFSNALYQADIVYVKDLYNENGKLNMEQFRLLDLNFTHYLEYESIINNTPRNWRHDVGNVMERQGPLEKEIELPIGTNRKQLQKMSSKDFYNLLLHTEYPIGAQKLRTKFNLNVSEISKVIALPYVTTKDNKLRELQFKLIHNILFTKFKLLRIGKVDSSLCAFCSSDIETIDHLFITCQVYNSTILVRTIQIH